MSSIRKYGLALRPVCILLLATAAAVLIHGYHMGIEDQDVYLAALNKSLHPDLYPVNSIFFTEQMKSSLFIPALAAKHPAGPGCRCHGRCSCGIWEPR